MTMSICDPPNISVTRDLLRILKKILKNFSYSQSLQSNGHHTGMQGERSSFNSSPIIMGIIKLIKTGKVYC